MPIANPPQPPSRYSNERRVRKRELPARLREIRAEWIKGGKFAADALTQGRGKSRPRCPAVLRGPAPSVARLLKRARAAYGPGIAGRPLRQRRHHNDFCG